MSVSGVVYGIFCTFFFVKTFTLFIKLCMNKVKVSEVSVRSFSFPCKTTITAYTNHSKCHSVNISRTLGLKDSKDKRLLLLEWFGFHTFITSDYKRGV